VAYVLVLISNMCIVNNCNKVPHKKSEKNPSNSSDF
jgi:hypothetical protein